MRLSGRVRVQAAADMASCLGERTTASRTSAGGAA